MCCLLNSQLLTLRLKVSIECLLCLKFFEEFKLFNKCSPKADVLLLGLLVPFNMHLLSALVICWSLFLWNQFLRCSPDVHTITVTSKFVNNVVVFRIRSNIFDSIQRFFCEMCQCLVNCTKRIFDCLFYINFQEICPVLLNLFVDVLNLNYLKMWRDL